MAFPPESNIPTSPPLSPENHTKLSVFTPPDKNTRSGVFMDVESTLAGDSQSIIRDSFKTNLNTEQEFDIIVTKVNGTIKELDRIYRSIGYSEKEMDHKKAEIFRVIQDTISSFTLNLQREKNNIQNECEWLRQQIRIILAMLNDNTGEKTLKLSSRGILFGDETMYQNGHKDDVFEQMKKYNSNNERFFSDSPFNMANEFSSDDFSMQQQCEYMVKQTPNLSLLQVKSALNSTFLEVLMAFVKSFSKFNHLNLIFWENIETIGECWPSTADISLISSLPTKSEAEEQAHLLATFEQAIQQLPQSGKRLSSGLSDVTQMKSSDCLTFIVSSPKKPNGKEDNSNIPDSSASGATGSIMDNLRDVNYKLVRSIRSLKLTKITDDVIHNLEKQIEWTENQMRSRIEKIKETISLCLSLISILNLSDQDLISMQKMHEMQNRENTSDSNESYFDVDTLRFIQNNPKEFGLMDHHLKFVTRLAGTLQSLKEAKQKRWDYYSRSCVGLWEKLGERKEYAEQFLEANSSLTDMSLSNLKMELKRLLIKRQEFVDTFIADARKSIKSLQDALYYSDEERKAFKYDEYTIEYGSEKKEEILNEHEAEVERLTKEYKSKESILSLYAQFNELIKDRKFLEESSKDSSRLLSKNSCKILLNEEKIRKRIHKNLPRVIENLKQEVIEFNNKQFGEGKRPITIRGEDFFEHVLLLEAENNNQRNSKPFRGNKGRVARAESPKKSNPRSSISPRKRSPAKIGKETSVRSRFSSSSNPIHSSGSSVIKNSFEKKHKSIIHNRRDSSILSPSLSFSPPKLQTRNPSSNLANLLGSHIQPLNSPLRPTETICADFDNKSDNSTLYSMCSRVSPLRNGKGDDSAMQANFSPIRVPLTNNTENKENHGIEIEKYALSPINMPQERTKSYQSENSEVSALVDDKRMSINSLANSTIIGDDYKLWRDEKIRRLNEDF
ncbi:hypothetical protein A9F13_12g01749 [Clavispora lusitaniae]|uniref:Anaphase spindle elongation protein n=1 Tax=Clavispora lusitaniae TaxID=36911 RepID=A0AA91PXY3_CLALS|nr:hypothetical protein E0198_002126 [Clavispora lusitaniae]OVF07629.1 hypothetical protein A9F13_12g01749 [Clavispora lusitaniae]